MEQNLLHVGLHVIENDIKEFYINILNAEIHHEFVLSEELSDCIFQKKQTAKVYNMLCQNACLELFVGDTALEHGYGHVCLQLSNVEVIAEKAIKYGYPCFIKTSNSNKKTCFIKDAANNLFELKEA